MALLLAGCGTLPSLEGRVESHSLTDTAGTRLGRAAAPDLAAHPGKTGIHPLSDAPGAFAARALLAAAADKSLDVQYYIWHGDQTGRLMFEALWHAAQRGVRVRLLLDDNGVAGLDDTLAALDAHPSIEVRLYNPFVNRRSRLLGYATDFTRLNRRMHNKSFTADGQVSIVGGRNIGNEYFGAGDAVLFEDLDVIAVGPAVRQVSEAFDLYWNSASAYPAALLLDAAGPDAAARLQADLAAARADPESVRYVRALAETELVRELLAGRLPLEWTNAHVLRDDPAKTLDTASRKELLLFTELLRTTADPTKSFDLVSPYFVPGPEGVAALGALAQRGVAVRVLTNSLAATDVGAVHAGYAKHRPELLRAGVRLYELKPTAEKDAPRPQKSGGGSSSASLHAKTFALDRSHVFVGSFNFDQRSAHLNTEMGLMIESAPLGRHFAATLDEDLGRTAYEVVLTPGGALEWVEGNARHDSEPGVGALRRAW
ncbi:MAG TPA: phospholipase D family protein, partial [Burkholderiales bacterium]